MAGDDLATQGAKSLATMILTKLNKENSVPTRAGLIHSGVAKPCGDIDLGQHWFAQWRVA